MLCIVNKEDFCFKIRATVKLNYRSISSLTAECTCQFTAWVYLIDTKTKLKALLYLSRF